MKSVSLLLAVSLTIASCNFGSSDESTTTATPTDTAKVDNTETPAAQEVTIADLPAGSKKQEIASQGVSITTAPGMKVEDLETFILVCSEEVVKDAKCFTLERYNKTVTLSDQETSITLKGRLFHYYLNSDGNGNQELEGYLQIDTQWYLVKTTDKDPTWIFPYLAHVELSNKPL